MRKNGGCYDCNGGEGLESDSVIFPATVFGSMSNGKRDIEAGPATRSPGDIDDGDSSSSPFDITRTKDASVRRLKRWRVCPFAFLTCSYYNCPLYFSII